MKRRTSFTVVLAAIVVAGLIAGGAFAYFHASGSGSGAATDGSLQAVTVQAVASGSPNSTLVPGGTADLIVQVQNPNSIAVRITSIAQNESGTPVVMGGNGCTPANDGVTVTTETGLSISVAPGTQVVDIAGAASMALSSASGCQGASFDLPVTLTVQQG
jgi:predicted ribosomally synthesized peptide with SipW-like signal peptide